MVAENNYWFKSLVVHGNTKSTVVETALRIISAAIRQPTEGDIHEP